MTFEEYQKEAVTFRTESANNEEYLTLGLIEEVGEAAGKLAKRRRDGVWDERAFIKELGDILWFVANLADYWQFNGDELSLDLEEDDDDMFLEDRMREVFLWTNEGLKFATEGEFESLLDNVGLMAREFGYTLEQVAEINLTKLRDRAARGKIHGNGDER